MNLTRIEVLVAVARNPGRVFLRATATTCSEGASPGRTVRIQEPKNRQAKTANIEALYKQWAARKFASR
jgi:hypothetical protein